MRIQEIVNVTDDRDRNFSVDFIFLCFDLELNSFELA